MLHLLPPEVMCTLLHHQDERDRVRLLIAHPSLHTWLQMRRDEAHKAFDWLVARKDDIPNADLGSRNDNQVAVIIHKRESTQRGTKRMTKTVYVQDNRIFVHNESSFTTSLGFVSRFEPWVIHYLAWEEILKNKRNYNVSCYINAWNNVLGISIQAQP